MMATTKLSKPSPQTQLVLQAMGEAPAVTATMLKEVRSGITATTMEVAATTTGATMSAI
jgi:hypothetical protein